jgi:hypothetical protein
MLSREGISIAYPTENAVEMLTYITFSHKTPVLSSHII